MNLNTICFVCSFFSVKMQKEIFLSKCHIVGNHMSRLILPSSMVSMKLAWAAWNWHGFAVSPPKGKLTLCILETLNGYFG